MEQGRPGLVPIVRLVYPLARAGDDDCQRVATRPIGPVYNLLDDQGDVWRPLVGSGIAPRCPGLRSPRHHRGRVGPAGDFAIDAGIGTSPRYAAVSSLLAII